MGPGDPRGDPTAGPTRRTSACGRSLSGIDSFQPSTEVRLPGESEQERWRRLRDGQVAARDPQTKQRRLHGQIARKQRSSVESFSIGRLWSEIPQIWKGALYGLFLGILGIVLVPLVWTSPWALPCAATIAVFATILGLIIGRAADTRDSLKDLMR
jgi:hypothetical protein